MAENLHCDFLVHREIFLQYNVPFVYKDTTAGTLQNWLVLKNYN